MRSQRPETAVEKAIREATERGAFDNLPLAGKPIPGLDQPFTPERWARDWIQREGGDTSALLSPLLLMRKERAALLASLAQVRTEADLREIITDFNHRLLDQYARTHGDIMIPVGVLDADETVARWLAERPAPPPPPPSPVAERRPRWWRRSRQPRRP